jgi:hypothetical protein
MERFNLDTESSEKLSHAFKVAKTFQEYHKPTSPEFKELEKFKKALLKQLKATRVGPTIEELDAIANAEAANYIAPDISARDEGVED